MSPTLPALVALALSTGGANVPENTVRSIAECVSIMTGLPVPSPLPLVVRGAEWTYEANGVCCDREGYYASSSHRAVSFYYWEKRVVLLSASASTRHLAHELASDMLSMSANIVKHSTVEQRNATDTWAYSVEVNYPFAECAE